MVERGKSKHLNCGCKDPLGTGKKGPGNTRSRGGVEKKRKETLR